MLTNSARLGTHLERLYPLTGIKWGPFLGGFSSWNRVFLADQGKFVCKVYGKWSLSALVTAHEVALEASKRQIPVPMPVATVSDEQYPVVHRRTLAIFPFMTGQVQHSDTLECGAHEQTAAMLARIHQIKFPSKIKSSVARRLLLSEASFIRKSVSLQKKHAALLSRENSQEVREVVAESFSVKASLLRAYPKKILENLDESETVCHGDFHNENILFGRDNKVLAVLDWEDACKGHGVRDVMMWVHFACLNQGFDDVSIANARHFIKAYLEARPISFSNLSLGLSRLYAELASSVFFEEQSLRALSRMGPGDTSHEIRYLQETRRDAAKIRYFLSHAREVQQNLLQDL